MIYTYFVSHIVLDWWLILRDYICYRLFLKYMMIACIYFLMEKHCWKIFTHILNYIITIIIYFKEIKIPKLINH